MITVKVSILLQYISIFVTHRGTAFHYTVRGLFWTNVLYYTIATILFVTEVRTVALSSLAITPRDADGRQCSPIQKLWEPTLPGHCFSRRRLGVASGIMNVISDFSILLLPLPLIWRLQMSWYKKSRVFAVFGFGLFACIASILRLVYSIELTHVTPNTLTYQLDVDKIGLWAYVVHYTLKVLILLTCTKFRRDSNRHHSWLPASPAQILQTIRFEGRRPITEVRDPL